MWQITEHKCSNQTQEIKVAMIVKEMARYSYATYSGEFESHFKERIKEIPKYNSFPAQYLYRVKECGLKKVEVWKMNVAGDFKYKMFTLDFISN